MGTNYIFSAKFILNNSSATINPDEFQVDATIQDGNSIFSSSDVMVNDIIFLDAFNSISYPSTVCKYKVISIISVSVPNITCVIKYTDTGAVLDPAEIAPGGIGYITRPSPNNLLAFHAAPTVHTVPDYVVQYARNIEMLTVVDNLGTSFQRETEIITLTPTDIANGFVTLSFTPINPSESLEVTPEGGPEQPYGTAYVYTAPNKVEWNGLSLDGLLGQNDILIINYDR